MDVTDDVSKLDKSNNDNFLHPKNNESTHTTPEVLKSVKFNASRDRQFLNIAFIVLILGISIFCVLISLSNSQFANISSVTIKFWKLHSDKLTDFSCTHFANILFTVANWVAFRLCISTVSIFILSENKASILFSVPKSTFDKLIDFKAEHPEKILFIVISFGAFIWFMSIVKIFELPENKYSILCNVLKSTFDKLTDSKAKHPENIWEIVCAFGKDKSDKSIFLSDEQPENKP